MYDILILIIVIMKSSPLPRSIRPKANPNHIAQRAIIVAFKPLQVAISIHGLLFLLSIKLKH